MIAVSALSRALLLSLTAAAYAAPVWAATVVHVQLQDPSADASPKSMHIAVDRDSVPAGKVTFRAVNQSKDQIHELLVVRVDSAQAALPYDENKQKVVEKKIRHLGEVPDLKPGRSGTLSLNLKPGSYLLMCNQPGHYKAGMSTPLTVTK